MKAKHKNTLEQIFHNPILAGIIWKEVETLLLAIGAEITEGRGSRVRIVLNGVRAVFHRPHPQKETNKGAVVSLRRFLREAGIYVDL